MVKTETYKGYTIVDYNNGYVIYLHGKRLVEVPTIAEAIEWIDSQ